MASLFALRLRRILAMSVIGIVPISAMAQTGQNVVPQTVQGLDSHGGQKLLPVGTGAAGTASAPMPVTAPADVPIPVTPGNFPILNLDASTLSGSAATTVLIAGHAVHGGWIAPTVAYCVNASITGATAGTVPNTPAGTECYDANRAYAIPALGPLGTVSVNSLVAGVAQGKGSL